MLWIACDYKKSEDFGQDWLLTQRNKLNILCILSKHFPILSLVVFENDYCSLAVLQYVWDEGREDWA